MYFESTIANKYPRCNAFIMSEMSPHKLKDAKPRVWNAFIRACNKVGVTDEEVAIDALTFASEPRLVICEGFVGLSDGSKGLGQNFFIDSPWFSVNQVQISNLRLLPYEKSIRGGFDMLKNAERLEATILHELVHWVRRKNNISADFINDDPEIAGEAGELFEMWAYGRLTGTMDEVRDALFSYPT